VFQGFKVSKFACGELGAERLGSRFGLAEIALSQVKGFTVHGHLSDKRRASFGLRPSFIVKQLNDY